MTLLPPTLLTPYGFSADTCGYCSPSGQRSNGKTSSKYGMVSEQLTPQFYQILVDRGWRRSGDFVYHPDMAGTCCPQYTIRLNCLSFKVTKKQRQVVNRFNRYLETGLKPGETALPAQNDQKAESSSSAQPHLAKDAKGKGKEQQKGKGKGKNNQANGDADVFTQLHAFEEGFNRGVTARHKFETELVPAKATPETFELYKAYQVHVHKDKPETTTMRGFSRFLCGNTLIQTPIEYQSDVNDEQKKSDLPKTYGQYHLLYRVDSKLIGISVLDILPKCVSSVYFIWHPDWAWASLGKLSALYEVSLARRMRDKGAEGMEWAYMGYWIPNCQKMKYKSEYSPSELLDPGTNIFHPLTPTLESFLTSHPRGYCPFTDIPSSARPSEITNPSLESSDEGAVRIDATSTEDGEGEDEDDEEEEVMSTWPSPPPPSFLDPKTISNKKIEEILILLGKGRGRTLVPVGHLEFGNPQSTYGEIKEFVSALGMEQVLKAGDTSTIGKGEKGILHFGQ